MNPIVSQMVAEDRMAARRAEAAAYRRAAAAPPRRRMPWARQLAARAAARLAAVLDPSLFDTVRSPQSGAVTFTAGATRR